LPLQAAKAREMARATSVTKADARLRAFFLIALLLQKKGQKKTAPEGL
jgi:hypothetical protein